MTSPNMEPVQQRPVMFVSRVPAKKPRKLPWPTPKTHPVKRTNVKTSDRSDKAEAQSTPERPGPSEQSSVTVEPAHPTLAPRPNPVYRCPHRSPAAGPPAAGPRIMAPPVVRMFMRERQLPQSTGRKPQCFWEMRAGGEITQMQQEPSSHLQSATQPTTPRPSWAPSVCALSVMDAGKAQPIQSSHLSSMSPTQPISHEEQPGAGGSWYPWYGARGAGGSWYPWYGARGAGGSWYPFRVRAALWHPNVAVNMMLSAPTLLGTGVNISDRGARPPYPGGDANGDSPSTTSSAQTGSSQAYATAFP